MVFNEDKRKLKQMHHAVFWNDELGRGRRSVTIAVILCAIAVILSYPAYLYGRDLFDDGGSWVLVTFIWIAFGVIAFIVVTQAWFRCGDGMVSWRSGNQAVIDNDMLYYSFHTRTYNEYGPDDVVHYDRRINLHAIQSIGYDQKRMLIVITEMTDDGPSTVVIPNCFEPDLADILAKSFGQNMRYGDTFALEGKDVEQIRRENTANMRKSVIVGIITVIAIFAISAVIMMAMTARDNARYDAIRSNVTMQDFRDNMNELTERYGSSSMTD